MKKYVGANYNDPDPVSNMDKYLAKPNAVAPPIFPAPIMAIFMMLQI